MLHIIYLYPQIYLPGKNLDFLRSGPSPRVGFGTVKAENISYNENARIPPGASPHVRMSMISSRVLL